MTFSISYFELPVSNAMTLCFPQMMNQSISFFMFLLHVKDKTTTNEEI